MPEQLKSFVLKYFCENPSLPLGDANAIFSNHWDIVHLTKNGIQAGEKLDNFWEENSSYFFSDMEF